MKRLLAGGLAFLVVTGQSPRDWTVAYDGGGSVRFGGIGASREIRLKPAPALLPSQTHAALVLTALHQFKYFELELTFTNVQALRIGVPQPWETFWLFFNYQPDGSFKKTNYLAFKTNGLEAGFASGDRDQKIFKTWESPVFPYGISEHIKIRRMATRFAIEINGQAPMIFEFATDENKPQALPGAIGLYTEDAEVLIQGITIKSI